MKRRQMRLPVEGAAPVKVGNSYKLCAGSTKIQTTCVALREEPLGALNQRDARREGYASVSGAMAAWKVRYGNPLPGRMVWVISFVLGDQRAFMGQDKPVYLSRSRDYTLQKHQALSGELEVMLVPGAAETARVAAIARRASSGHEILKGYKETFETLRESLTSMRARNELRRLEHVVKKLEAECP